MSTFWLLQLASSGNNLKRINIKKLIFEKVSHLTQLGGNHLQLVSSHEQLLGLASTTVKFHITEAHFSLKVVIIKGSSFMVYASTLDEYKISRVDFKAWKNEIY